MKNLILSVLFMGFISTSMSSQEIGVRFGDATGGDVAIDAIFSSGEYSRIHADVSFGNGVGLDVLWDFIYKPLGEGGLKWYAGVGANTFLGDPFTLGVLGEVGLEYRFKNSPIVIGADWRPGLRIIDNTDFTTDNFGFNLRYAFK